MKIANRKYGNNLKKIVIKKYWTYFLLWMIQGSVLGEKFGRHSV